jgi:glycosyltransferase involved in cell wall biosynthesis
MWVTALTWARALEERFGEVYVCLPGSTSVGASAVEPHTREGAPRPTRARRGPHLPTLRTLAKDVLLLTRRGRARYAYALPEHVRPALVWQHHDLLVDAGGRLAARTGAPLVQYVDAPQVWEARRWGVRRPGWGRLLERVAEVPQLRRADVVSCVSSEVGRAATARGATRERIVITPCTADPHRFHPQVDGTAVRERLGLAPDHVVFGWVGSFRRFHGLHDIVRAFRLVVDRLPDARLLLVGDGAEQPAVRRHLTELGLLGRTLLPGAVPYEEVPPYVAAMDVTLVTAERSEDFHYSPLKLREYLAAGRAVVSGRVGQVKEEFTDGVHVEMYEVGDVASLAAAMLRLGTDPDHRARLARAGHDKESADNGIAALVERVVAAAARNRVGVS